MRRPSGYRVFLTQRSEYHVRGHVCFGVRSRKTGDMLEGHWAVDRRLATSFADGSGRLLTLALPAIGEPLRFEVDGELLTTTPVLAIEEREYFELVRPGTPKFDWVGDSSGDARDTY